MSNEKLNPRTKMNIFAFAYLILIVAWVGCDRNDIESYKAPKESKRSASAPVQPATSPQMAGRQATGSPHVSWTVPEGWRQLPGTRTMRIATFEAGSAELTLEIVVSVFPGDVGGRRANINRWRGQLGLKSITDGNLSQQIRDLDIMGSSGFIFDESSVPSGESESPTRMIVVIVETDQWTWFIKAMGPPTLLDEHQSAIEQFAQSFRFSEAPTSDRERPEPSSGREIPITWDQPKHWRIDSAPPSMLTAAFNIGEGQHTARVTVMSLPGAGGGALANINRWRSQVGLPTIQDLNDQPRTRLEVAGFPAAVLDLAAPSGGDHGKRMIVVMVLQTDQTWFLKLEGHSHQVEDEKATFLQFVRSLRFQ